LNNNGKFYFLKKKYKESFSELLSNRANEYFKINNEFSHSEFKKDYSLIINKLSNNNYRSTMYLMQTLLKSYISNLSNMKSINEVKEDAENVNKSNEANKANSADAKSRVAD